MTNSNNIQWESIEEIAARIQSREDAVRNAIQAAPQTRTSDPNNQILIQNINENNFEGTGIDPSPFYNNADEFLGHIFSVEGLQAFARAKNYTVGDMSPTEYAGIMRATISKNNDTTASNQDAKAVETTENGLIKTAPPHWTVDGKSLINASFTEDWNWEDLVNLIEEQLLMFVDKKYIKVRYSGETRSPASSGYEDHLYMYFYSAPSGRYYKNQYTPKKILGLRLWEKGASSQCYMFKVKEGEDQKRHNKRMDETPGWDGDYHIIDPESGLTLAIYYQHNSTLFILLDIFRGNYKINENREAILQFIMEEFKAYLTKDYCQDLVKEASKNIKQMLFDSRIGLIFQSNLHSLQRSVDKAKQRLIDYTSGLKTESHNVLVSEGQLEGLKNKKDEIGKKVSEEIQKLNTIEQIEKIDFSKTTITIFTKNILCYDELKKLYRSMGRYRIPIDLANHSARWYNLDKQIDGSRESMMHPHIQYDGVACQGSLTTPLIISLSSFEYYNAAVLVISFVETANVADAFGKYIPNWPAATEKELIEGRIENVETWFPKETTGSDKAA